MAATIAVNPCTAYRMLKDFEDLQPGETVIQNGGNSAVGQAVIQLCREFGLKSISLVRNRKNLDEVKAQLESLGDSNTMVLTDEELREHGRKIKAQLALNCVGGKSGTDILRALGKHKLHYRLLVWISMYGNPQYGHGHRHINFTLSHLS